MGLLAAYTSFDSPMLRYIEAIFIAAFATVEDTERVTPEFKLVGIDCFDGVLRLALMVVAFDNAAIIYLAFTHIYRVPTELTLNVVDNVGGHHYGRFGYTSNFL